jgi:hypothetical protein
MVEIACAVGGTLLILCSFGLSRVPTPDWQSEGEFDEKQQKAIGRWAAVQRTVRRTNNILLAVIGCGIIATIFVAADKPRLVLWAAILLLLLLSIGFALLDAVSSLASYRIALPEAARRSLGNDASSSNN